jgi:ADP-ribose pyrophosphatase
VAASEGDTVSGSTNFVAKMRDAQLLSSEVLVDAPKRFTHEVLRMPNGEVIDWYFVDTTPSVMVVPITNDGDVILVRQYRHNLKRDTLELPAGVAQQDEQVEDAALRELEEETGYVLAATTALQPLGPFYSLPSETNKYVHFFLAAGVVGSGTAPGDSEIERYFEMSVVAMPLHDAVKEIGFAITGLETAGGLLLAQAHLGGADRT